MRAPSTGLTTQEWEAKLHLFKLINSTSQGRVAEASPSGEPPGEATTQYVDTASSVAAKATAIAAVTAEERRDTGARAATR